MQILHLVEEILDFNLRDAYYRYLASRIQSAITGKAQIGDRPLIGSGVEHRRSTSRKRNERINKLV